MGPDIWLNTGISSGRTKEKVSKIYAHHDISYPYRFRGTLGPWLHRQLLQSVQHLISAHQVSKHGMLLIEMESGFKRNEPLGPKRFNHRSEETERSIATNVGRIVIVIWETSTSDTNEFMGQ